MQEWVNPYNSFNSYKGLLYRTQFDRIISGNLPPPVEVNIDPVNNCSLKCVWCNGKKIIDRSKEVVMSTEHLIDICYFLKDWGVKAVCIAGGGEPTQHPNLALACELLNKLKIEIAIITNGLFLNDIQLETVAKYSRWIGISVDAVCEVTYKKCKGEDKFQEVIENIERLVSLKAKEITFKFLIHPFNQREIYDACRMAKSIGVNRFHSRLLSTRYLNSNNFDYKNINEQLDKCMELNDTNFEVFTITHKQEGEGNRRIRFNKCRASPLLCTLEADGTVSICIDRKGIPETMLCRHDNLDELKKMWGSKFHKDLLAKINPETDCEKCTMTIYQELLDAYEKDSFCKNFP